MSKMWKKRFGVILSFGVMLLPFMGLPRSLKDILYTLAGALLLVIFFMLARDRVNE